MIALVSAPRDAATQSDGVDAVFLRSIFFFASSIMKRRDATAERVSSFFLSSFVIVTPVLFSLVMPISA